MKASFKLMRSFPIKNREIFKKFSLAHYWKNQQTGKFDTDVKSFSSKKLEIFAVVDFALAEICDQARWGFRNHSPPL
jgi:hypothetical protein